MERGAVPKAVTAVVLYLFFWASVFTTAIAVPSLDDPSCFGVMADKHRILDRTRSPKIVMTGGSNVLFGVDGVQVEHALHRPFVNMGMCLMFTAPFLFEEIKNSIGPGDLVIFSPEYMCFSSELENPIVMADILDGYPAAIQWILKSDCCSPEVKGKIVFHLRTIGLDKLNYVLTHLSKIFTGRCTWSHGKYNPGLQVLKSSNLDKCGGLIWHLKQKHDAQPNLVRPLAVCKHVDEHFVSEVNKFADYCHQHGAQMVLIPVPIPKTLHRRNRAGIDSLLAEAKSRLKIPVLGTSERYTFPDSWIFSEHYHLNKHGRPVRTERLIEDIRPYLPLNNSGAKDPHGETGHDRQ